MSARARAPKRRAKQKVRRSNAERSATTRGKLIDAALTLLHAEGYAATTTDLVARRARVSRGAMLHHFKTRADLMVAVAEFVMADQRRQRTELIDRYADGPERFFAAADVSWDIQKQPATIALLEIMLASRSDKALRKRMAPLMARIREYRLSAAKRLTSNLGIEDVDTMVDLLRLHLAALRGLAIELLFTQTPEDVERARLLLKRYEHGFARELMQISNQGESSKA